MRKSEKSSNHNDLLTTTLKFPISFSPKKNSSFNIFDEVTAGKISNLSEHFHQLTLKTSDSSSEIERLLNTPDNFGRSPLYYAM